MEEVFVVASTDVIPKLIVVSVIVHSFRKFIQSSYSVSQTSVQANQKFSIKSTFFISQKRMKWVTKKIALTRYQLMHPLACLYLEEFAWIFDLFFTHWWVNGGQFVSFHANLYGYVCRRNFTRAKWGLWNNKATKIFIFACMYHIAIMIDCFFVCLDPTIFTGWLQYKQKQSMFQMTKFYLSCHWQRCRIRVCFVNVFTHDISNPVRYSLRTKTPYCNNESLLGVDIYMTVKTTENCIWLLFFLREMNYYY